MSVRNLPAASAPDAPDGARWDLHPQARAKWDSAVTAAADDNASTITILEPIGVDFFGNGVTAKRVAAALRAIGNQPVTVVINSPGGDYFEGLAIYNLLREHPKAVTVQVIGIAASAASVIAMAGDDIQIGKAAMMFVHNSQLMAAGDRHTMNDAADKMQVFDDAMASVYADRSGEDAKKVHQWMDAETFFSGEQAIEAGLADELLKSDAQRKVGAEMETPPAYRLEALLEHYGIPRAERRKAMRELIEIMPGAEIDRRGTPGAADCAEGLAHLRVAAMRLGLN